MTKASSNPRGGRRWVGVAAVLAVVVLALVWWLRSSPEPVSSAAPEPQVANKPAPPATPVAARPTPAPGVPEQPPVDQPPPEMITPSQPGAAPPIPLPPSTQPLAEEFFPGTTEWEEVPADNARQYMLRILPVRYNVVAPMPIAVQLELVDRAGRRQPLVDPRVRLRSADDDTRPWIEVPVRDDGSGADTQGGDGQYTATLVPDATQKRLLLGRVLVEGSVYVPGTGLRTIPAILIYTEGPRAKVTGKWRDYVKDGHLYLEAELDVEQAGLFTLMAQVFGPQMEPLAWVKETAKLNKGRGTITLQVWGKLLHDSGIDGPYRVRQVLLTRDHENTADYEPGVTIEEAHRTKPYRASEFSSVEYTEPPRVVEEVTAESPTQQDKPPPLRDRGTR